MEITSGVIYRKQGVLRAVEKTKAVLFDLDGTLLDTLEDLADSMNAALKAHNLAPHPVEAYKLFVGDGVENLVLRAAPRVSEDAELFRNLLLEMRDQYGRRWAGKSRPYPGIAELLDELTARRAPMAVLSNKPREFTELCVVKLLSRWRFSEIRGIDADTPRKPDPTGALEIARRIGVSPPDFFYLGDTATDMRTAVGAGMRAVGALWGFRGAEELVGGGAEILIDYPTKLINLLDRS